MIKRIKVEVDPALLNGVKEQIRQILKKNDLCCCAPGSLCNNCAMIMGGLVVKSEKGCNNCAFGVKRRATE